MLKELFKTGQSSNGSGGFPKGDLSTLSEAQLYDLLDPKRLPRHIAVIMDGNGRWAKRKGMPRVAGHRAGIDALREQTRICGELGIEVLTVFAFSTENWDRPREEVNFLFRLLDEVLDREVAELHKNNVQLRVIGRRSSFSASLTQKIRAAEELTRGNDGLILNVSFNYGGRAEIVDAARQIASMAKRGDVSEETIDEALVSSLLYTSGLPDPDLLIRTGGEARISNFLLWQAAYAEIWFTPVYWPDFKERHLLEALIDYQRRERRFGRV